MESGNSEVEKGIGGDRFLLPLAFLPMSEKRPGPLLILAAGCQTNSAAPTPREIERDRERMRIPVPREW